MRASAAGFVVISAIFFSWATLYLTRTALLSLDFTDTCTHAGGKELLGEQLYDQLDIGQLDLRGSGLSS